MFQGLRRVQYLTASAFKKEEIDNTFGEYLAAKGLKQLRLAETE